MKGYFLAQCVSLGAISIFATTDNIAPMAKVTASPSANGSSPNAINDGVVYT